MMPPWLYESIYGWHYPKVSECGDALLTDSGPGFSSDQYVVDYGPLSFNETTDITVRLCELPREWMFAGLEVELAGEDGFAGEIEQFREGNLQAVDVTISIRTQEGRPVTSNRGALGARQAWYWSSGENNRSTFIWGDGTAFLPRHGQAYELGISILPSNEETDLRARLLVKGGGWKAPVLPSDQAVETLKDLAR